MTDRTPDPAAAASGERPAHPPGHDDDDDARGTDLLRTLEEYFRAGGSPRHAATALHVHVHVTQRLDRVRALIGEDWQTAERVLELQLALRLREVLGEA